MRVIVSRIVHERLQTLPASFTSWNGLDRIAQLVTNSDLNLGVESAAIHR